MDTISNSKKTISSYVVLLLKVILSVSLLFWLVSSGRLNLSLFRDLGRDNLVSVSAVCFLNFIQVFLVASRWHLLQKVRSIEMPWMECLRLSALGNFFNVCLPGNAGGELVKSYCVSQYFLGKRVEAVTVIFFNLFLGFLTLGMMSVMAVLLVLFMTNHPTISLLATISGLTFLILAAGLVLIFDTRLRSSSLMSKFLEKIPLGFWMRRAYDEAHSFREHKTTLVVAIMLSLVAHSLQIFAFFLVGRLLDDTQGLGIYFVVTPLVFLANALPITPGGLGIGESVSSILLDGSGAGTGASIMLVFRVAFVLVAIVMGLPAYLVGHKGRRAKRIDRSGERSVNVT
jgi:uncharacterized protein (TIRG00374 family)